MDDKMLESLGLTLREIKIFRAVLKGRELSPALLAKATGIKRTSAYSIARGLVEKGFLVENAMKRPRTFASVRATDVDSIIAGERKRLTAREHALKQFGVELSRVTAGEQYAVPAIRFVEEEKLDTFLRTEVSKWNKSIQATDNTWWGFQDHSYVEQFAGFIDAYWKTAPKNIEVKILSNQSVAEYKIKGRYPNRKIKFWNKGSTFLSTTWVTGEFVITLNTRKHPFHLVEIHDATLAHDMREVFKNLWNLV